MLRKMLIILFSSLVFAGAAQAQPALAFGPQLGLFKAQDADEGEYMFGGLARLKLSKSLAVQGAINYRQENYNDGQLNLKVWPVSASGLFYVLPFAYGTIGMSWNNTTQEFMVEGSDEAGEKMTSQEVGWHFGGGLELPFGEKAKITADVKYLFINYEFDELPWSKTLNNDGLVISGGLLFFL